MAKNPKATASGVFSYRRDDGASLVISRGVRHRAAPCLSEGRCRFTLAFLLVLRAAYNDTSTVTGRARSQVPEADERLNLDPLTPAVKETLDAIASFDTSSSSARKSHTSAPNLLVAGVVDARGHRLRGIWRL